MATEAKHMQQCWLARHGELYSLGEYSRTTNVILWFWLEFHFSKVPMTLPVPHVSYFWSWKHMHSRILSLELDMRVLNQRGVLWPRTAIEGKGWRIPYIILVPNTQQLASCTCIHQFEELNPWGVEFWSTANKRWEWKHDS
jgi:hypothetical protein